MYFESASPDAEELTIRHNNRNRGGRRDHAIFEARNFICAHIKRDDPVSRRLIQYLAMQSHTLIVLVRDAETGKLLIKPEEEERWLLREKSGIGRASRNSGWNVLKSVGPAFFEEMDRYRKWKFSFKEYYDVYVWDLVVGEPFAVLYNTVQEVGLEHVIVLDKSLQSNRCYLKPTASALVPTCIIPQSMFSRLSAEITTLIATAIYNLGKIL